MNNELTLREIQLGTLSILKKIDSICKEIGIEYWGMYGTMLGAIRHKGFIPWDDDLDIGMKRKDYDIFVQYCIDNSEKLLPYSIDNFKTVENYPFYISRFCDNRYIVQFDGISYESGLFIDIYAFDGMGDEEDLKLHRRREKLLKLWQKGILARSVKGLKYGANTRKQLLNAPILIYGKLRGNSYFVNKLDNECKKHSWDESKYVGTPAWEFRPIQFRKELFDEIIEVPFEDYVISVPKAYDEILTIYYGNYMQLPPENQRIAHHFYHAFKK